MDFELLLAIFPQVLLDGIILGFMYALIALGYTMVYGVLEFINFAHSDVYMIGAFTGFYLANSDIVQSSLGSSPLVAVLVMVGAMAACACVGMLIERFAYRPGRSPVRFVLSFWIGILGAAVGYLAFVPPPAWRRLIARAADGWPRWARRADGPESMRRPVHTGRAA